MDNPDIRLLQAIRFRRRLSTRLNFEYNPRVEFFSKLFKEKGLLPLVGAEIGVDNGEYTYRLLKELGDKVKMMYCVDPYLPYRDRRLWKQQQIWDSQFIRVLHRFAHYENVVMLRLPSVEGAWVVPDCLDYAWIDGNHSYPSVTEDIHLWEEKIKDGGILAGHDYNFKKYHSVTHAADDYARKMGRELHNPVRGCFYWEVHR